MKFVEEKDRFALYDGDDEIGEMTWRDVSSDFFVITHTIVNPAYRGQHLAEELVEHGVEKARREGRKIIPECSYAKTLFERREDFADVWEKE
ncbi:MAG: N-acetyltransferase [Streptococcaceae bacterium]|jgi:predicted GNAT family acetyltransferase|nr:N-acetyltransferase [Streptococcaceae bacterium]